METDKKGGEYKRTGKQFFKFALVGGLNTLIDIGVLNLLMFIFDVYQGSLIALFNLVSVSAAITNSYFWNKYWTFGAKKEKDQFSEFSLFVLVAVGGAAINTGVVYIVSTLIEPQFGLSQEIWANLGKILAVGASWLWNFSGYKFFVFKK